MDKSDGRNFFLAKAVVGAVSVSIATYLLVSRYNVVGKDF